MGTVTYHKQPGIHKTRGSVPLTGTSHVYTVSDLLWPDAVEQYLQTLFIGNVLHVCSGKSQLGDVHVDLFAEDVDVVADAARLPFADRSFSTVLIDPPYNGKFQWNHDMLNELIRVTDFRVIFQHWYLPVNKDGQFKKAHAFELRSVALVPTLSGHEDELKVCLYDDENDTYYIADEDGAGDVFNLKDLAVWQPRAYFGRAQVIQTYDRAGMNEVAYLTGYEQLYLPLEV